MRALHHDTAICRRQGVWFRRQPRTIIICTTVMGALLATAARPISAATEVRGEESNVQLRAENASTREMLDALAAKFNLTYKLPADVNQTLTGLYSGPIRQVLGPVAELVGNEGGVVTGVINLESPDVRASGRRPRHEEQYHEA